jgi:hypothetical protein
MFLCVGFENQDGAKKGDRRWKTQETIKKLKKLRIGPQPQVSSPVERF